MRKWLWVVLLGGLLSGLPAARAEDKPADDKAEPVIRVGILRYSENQKIGCFSPAFLEMVDRESTLKVDRAFHEVKIESDKLFEYPMVVISGIGRIELTEAQVKNLKAYIQRSGLILASNTCEDEGWDRSFREAMTKVLGDEAMFKPVPLEHPMLHTLYDIDAYRTAKQATDPLQAITINQRATVVYSPIDLRDTKGMPAECCCCGGNELLNARLINADVLVYAVTH